MSTVFFLIVFPGPLILTLVAFGLFARIFDRIKAALFLSCVAFLLSANMWAAFRARDAYLAKGGWTAATLAPLNYWLLSYPIVLLNIAVWFVGLWGWRLWRRRVRVHDGLMRSFD